MRSYEFPPEINEQWIDCLRDHRAALKACSLTRRGLVPLSQRYLFEYVKVQSAPRWLRFLKTLRRSAEVGTDIGQYIRKLELTDISIGSRVHDLFVDIVRNASSLSRLPNVQELVLPDWNWSTLVDRALDYDPVSAARHVLFTLLPFPRVHSVALVNNVVRYPHIIPEVLATFSSLATLRIESLQFSDSALNMDHLPFQHGATAPDVTPIQLQDMSLCYDFHDAHHAAAADFMLKALLPGPPCKLSLHTFHVEGTSMRWDEARPPVLDALTNISQTCERLSISEHFLQIAKTHIVNPVVTVVGPELALCRFPRLKFLALRWNALPPPTSPLNTAFLLRGIESLVTPPSTNDILNGIEMRFCLALSHAMMEERPYLLDDLDVALVPLHICCPAMALHLHFFFHVFVPRGARGSTPDILSLLRPVVRRAVANGLQLKVTTVTTVFTLAGNIQLETLVEEPISILCSATILWVLLPPSRTIRM